MNTLSVADIAAVNAEGIKILSANGLSTFFINNSKPTFINAPKSLPRNFPDCAILDSWFLLILYLLMNYSRKLDQALKLVYQLVITCVKN